jgi:hypothetical protein
LKWNNKASLPVLGADHRSSSMASQFAVNSVPSFIAALPFLFARPQADDLGWTCRSALAAAVAAERADDTRRNTRGRIAYVLCELGYQLGRRGADRDAELPIARVEIARALGVSLCRLKRTFALLALSQVIEGDGQRIRVTDWHRLARLGGYDPRRLQLNVQEDEAEVVPESDEAPRLTVAGDQACFV